MKMMAANGVLEGLKSIDMGVCESYFMEKYKRVSFTKAAREPKKVRLEIIHIDVWGTISSFIIFSTKISLVRCLALCSNNSLLS